MFTPSPQQSIDPVTQWSTSGLHHLSGHGSRVPQKLVRYVSNSVEELLGRGVDPSLEEALTFRGPLGILAQRAAVRLGRPATHLSYGGFAKIVHASDGPVVYSLPRAGDQASVPAWLEVDAELDGRALDREIGTRSIAYLSERARWLGIAFGAVDEVGIPSVLLSESQSDVAEQAPGNSRADRPGADISGALVVNLASLWAGPLAGRILAGLGARVINVESPQRPDGGRSLPPFFEFLRDRQELVAFDIKAREAENLVKLIDAADVVIEGSRPRALAQLGIDTQSYVANGKVWVSITGHGRTGERAERIGFGDDAAVIGGLTGNRNDALLPTFLGDAIADPITGIVAAMSAVRSIEHGAAALHDVNLAGVSRMLAGDWVDIAEEVDRPQPVARLARRLARPVGDDNPTVYGEFGLTTDRTARSPEES